MRLRTISVRLLAAAWALSVVLPYGAEAHARRAGLVLISHGKKIKKLADLPPEAGQLIQKQIGAIPEVGYKYSHFGVFWLSLWTWGGEYCLFHDKTIYPFDDAAITGFLGKPVSSLGRPFGYRFPTGLLVIAILAIGSALFSKFGRAGESQSDQLVKLFEDPRYQRALNILQLREERGDAEPPGESESDDDDDGGFGAAVNHLMSQGVPETEAEQNLAKMIHAISTSAEQKDDEAEE